MKKNFILGTSICLVLGLSVLGVLIIPSTCYACDCDYPPHVEEEFERSEAVFSGKVIKIIEQHGLGGKKVLFEVKKTWKGGTESQTIITTGNGGGDCGYGFKKGKEYLVYANQSSMYGDQNELVSIICSRTAELSEAQEDLEILGEGTAPNVVVNLENEVLKGMHPVIWIIAFIVSAIVIFLVISRFKKT